MAARPRHQYGRFVGRERQELEREFTTSPILVPAGRGSREKAQSLATREGGGAAENTESSRNTQSRVVAENVVSRAEPALGVTKETPDTGGECTYSSGPKDPNAMDGMVSLGVYD